MADDVLYDHNYQIRDVEVTSDKNHSIIYKHNFEVQTTELDNGEVYDLGPSWCQDRFPAFGAAWSLPIEFVSKVHSDEFERIHKESRNAAMEWYGRTIAHCFPLAEALAKSPLGKAFASSPNGEKVIIVEGDDATMHHQQPYKREFVGSTDLISLSVEKARQGSGPYGVPDIIKACVWRPVVPEKDALLPEKQ